MTLFFPNSFLFFMYGSIIVFYITVQTPIRRNPRSIVRWILILMKTSSRTMKTGEGRPGVGRHLRPAWTLPEAMKYVSRQYGERESLDLLFWTSVSYARSPSGTWLFAASNVTRPPLVVAASGHI